MAHDKSGICSKHEPAITQSYMLQRSVVKSQNALSSPEIMCMLLLILIIGFQYCARIRAAQNFTMPAMSPTMTEGNIANWKVKEGN